jgi:hypothetical protein
LPTSYTTDVPRRTGTSSDVSGSIPRSYVQHDSALPSYHYNYHKSSRSPSSDYRDLKSRDSDSKKISSSLDTVTPILEIGPGILSDGSVGESPERERYFRRPYSSPFLNLKEEGFERPPLNHSYFPQRFLPEFSDSSREQSRSSEESLSSAWTMGSSATSSSTGPWSSSTLFDWGLEGVKQRDDGDMMLVPKLEPTNETPYGNDTLSSTAGFTTPSGHSSRNLMVGSTSLPHSPPQLNEPICRYHPDQQQPGDSAPKERHVYHAGRTSNGLCSENEIEGRFSSCDQLQVSSCGSDKERVTRVSCEEGVSTAVSDSQVHDSDIPSSPTLNNKCTNEQSSSVQGEPSSRTNTLSSITEDDTDWGDDEITGSLQDLHFPGFSAFSKEKSPSQDLMKESLTQPIFSPMKQALTDRIMKEFWDIFNQESEATR